MLFHLHVPFNGPTNSLFLIFRLVVNILGLLRKQFFLLKGAGLATSDLTEEFDTIVGTVEHSRELAWADQSSENFNISSLVNFHSIVAGRKQHMFILLH